MEKLKTGNTKQTLKRQAERKRELGGNGERPDDKR